MTSQIAAHDRRRYFTLVYNSATHLLKLHYYVQCVGSTPVNFKGGIAVGTSTGITVKDRKLTLANPGYTWLLSADDAQTAQWMANVLVAAVKELKNLPPGKIPVLAYVAGQLTPPPSPPHLAWSELVAQVNAGLIAAGYTQAEMSVWAPEIPGAVEAALAAGRREHFAREMPGPPPAWFTKTGRKVGTSYPRYLIMTAYDEIIAYARTVGGDGSSDRSADDGAAAATGIDAAATLVEQAIDQKSVLAIGSNSSAVASGSKLQIVGDGGKTWQLEASAAEIATSWADAVTALAKLKMLDADLSSRRVGMMQPILYDGGDPSSSPLDTSTNSTGSAVGGGSKQPRPLAAIAGQWMDPGDMKNLMNQVKRKEITLSMMEAFVLSSRKPGDGKPGDVFPGSSALVKIEQRLALLEPTLQRDGWGARMVVVPETTWPVVDWLDPETVAGPDAPDSGAVNVGMRNAKVGDLVLSINGVDTAGMTQEEVDGALAKAAESLAHVDPETPSLALAVVLEVVDCACAPGATTFVLSHPTGIKLVDSTAATSSDCEDSGTAGQVIECIPGGNAEQAGVWPKMRLQRIQDTLCITLPRQAVAELLATPLDARRGVAAVATVEIVLFNPAAAAAAAARAALGGSRTSSSVNSRANSNRSSLMTLVAEDENEELSVDKEKLPTLQAYENVVLLPPAQNVAAAAAASAAAADPTFQTTDACSDSGADQVYENVMLQKPLTDDHVDPNRPSKSLRKPIPAPRPNTEDATTPTTPTAPSPSAPATVSTAQVLYTFSATDDTEMSLVAGETITVFDTGAGTGDVAWWAGVITDGGVVRSGWFPAAYVLPILPSAAEASRRSAEVDDPYASSSDEEDGSGGRALASGGSGSGESISAAGDGSADPYSNDDSDDDLPPNPERASTMSEMYAAVAEMSTVDGLAHAPQSAAAAATAAAADDDDHDDVDADDDGSYAILSPDGSYIDEEEQKKIGAEQKKEADVRRAAKRKRVAQEMLATEAAYVLDLEAMVEGYVKKMRPLEGQLFDAGSIDVLFSNVEQLYIFQKKFVARLEVLVEEQGPNGASECFLEFADSFEIYSVYCSNHTRASEALEHLLAQSEQAWSFFEGCRLLLDGAMSVAALMIKPVQRICQYPLLLGELGKITGEGHPDYSRTCTAGAKMKTIALSINEDKRLREEVAAIQNKIDGWTGPPLSVWSSRQDLFSFRKIEIPRTLFGIKLGPELFGGYHIEISPQHYPLEVAVYFLNYADVRTAW